MEKDLKKKAEERMSAILEEVKKETDEKRVKMLLDEFEKLGDLVFKYDKNELDNSKFTQEYDMQEKEKERLLIEELNKQKSEKRRVIFDWVKLGIKAVGIVVWVYINLKVLKFEETGTIRTKIFSRIAKPDVEGDIIRF